MALDADSKRFIVYLAIEKQEKMLTYSQKPVKIEI